MGCGVTKLSVPEPINPNGPDDSSEELRNQINQKPGSVGDSEAIEDEVKLQKNSPGSVTPQCLKSGEKVGSPIEDESMKQQIPPFRIKTLDDENMVNQPSPVTREMKRGYLAFDIPYDDSQDTPVDSKKQLPRRLRHLEPLEHAPKFTTEMVIEKLEKAQEKRQRAMIRSKEQSFRRRETALRWSEQMGDTAFNNQSSCSHDGPKSTSTDSEKLVNGSESGQIAPESTIGRDANMNWNENELLLMSPTKMISLLSNDDKEEVVSQNNNSLTVRLATPVSYRPEQDCLGYSGPWPTLLSTEKQCRRTSMRFLATRTGMFLQSVQEEDRETDEETQLEETEEEEEEEEDEEGMAWTSSCKIENSSTQTQSDKISRSHEPSQREHPDSVYRAQGC